MAPNPKIAQAFRAMREIGIDEETVKPVLKHMLKLYDKNWNLIEEDNYSVLADAIFDSQESKAAEQKKKPEEHDEFLNEADESERPLKRLRTRHQGSETSSSPQRCSIEQSQEMVVSTLPNLNTESQPVSYHQDLRPRRKQHVSPQASAPKRLQPVLPSSQVQPSDKRNELLPAPISCRENRSASPNLSHGLQLREPKTEPNIILLPKKRPDMLLTKPKNEPITINDDMLQFEVPIAILPPDPSCQVISSLDYNASQQADEQENPASHCVDGRDNSERGNASSSERGNNNELANIADESPPHIDVASTPLGEVKISLICNPVNGKSQFLMPSLAEVLKLVEDKCLKTYKISDPNFVMNLMRDMCEACLELGTESTNELLENTPDARIDSLEKLSGAHDAQGLSGVEEQTSNPVDDSVSIEVAIPEILKFPPSISGMDNHVLHNNKYTQNGICGSDGATTIPVAHLLVDIADENSHSMVVYKQHELTPDQLRAFFDKDDISRGEERVKIALVYEINNDPLPSFHYIPNNLVFQTACVNFSLAQVGNEDCCSNCFGDCLSLSKPCACALETGGEFAYTSDGTLKEKFLEESISMKQDPQKHTNFYCKECPLERSTNDHMAEQCKGHLKRKFIKECWSKCGCRKQCGNRVVQRGITGNLQVFMTAGKGWGLRSLEELPKGAFVCEYVGEILTTSEVYQRKMQSTGCHSYPVSLDADWGAEMKDEKALCLDTTHYGNAARFINHRCLDANMIEIPVEVENPDHHYYHLAFFTTRKVDTMEELTWDYGIDFDNDDNRVKAFRCRCGSTFCRNMKRYTKRCRSIKA